MKANSTLSDPIMSRLNRRNFISGIAVAGMAGFAGFGPSKDERRLPDEGKRIFHNVLHVDVQEGPDAVQAAIDEADRSGMNKVVIYGKQAEWNKPVYLPSNSTVEMLEGVKITSSMNPQDAKPFEVGAGTVCGALFTNKDHENGNKNITIRGGQIDFGGVTDESIVWAPVWLHNCDHSRFDSIVVENVVRSYGVMFSDCRNSIMTDCVARNIGYDGIAIRLDCRRIDVYRCEAYECGGPGIQAATFGRGAGATHDISFIHCRTTENIFVHGYQGPGGARGILIHGCTAHRIAMIGQVEDFTITSCKTTSVGLSCLNDTIRNGRIDSVSFSDLYGPGTEAVTRIRSRSNGSIENITFSNCSARTYSGRITRFGQTLLEAGSSARYIDYVNCAFDARGSEGPTVFFQHNSEGSMAKVRIHGCKIHNAARVVEGPVDGVRIRDCELHNVGSLHDGRPVNIKTRDNDDW
ncbi:MAG: right-handed parallel beta-helix repeat-containing protein [Balneolales bacterium]